MDPGYPNIVRDFSQYLQGTFKYSTTVQDTMEEHGARKGKEEVYKGFW